MNVGQLFECHHITKEKKVPMATLNFQGHYKYWWTSLVRDLKIHNQPQIKYWNELRSTLRRRHVPSYYDMELWTSSIDSNKKNMSVGEYQQKNGFTHVKGRNKKGIKDDNC